MGYDIKNKRKIWGGTRNNNYPNKPPPSIAMVTYLGFGLTSIGC